jgi:hypothetical protein
VTDPSNSRVPSSGVAKDMIKSVHRYLAKYEVPFGHVRPEREPVVHVLWVWLIWLSEQATYVSRNADRASGLVLLPMVRSVGEHADAMLWLADAGDDGVLALHVSKQRHQQLLFDAYVFEQGHPPPGLARVPDTHILRTVAQQTAMAGLQSVVERQAIPQGWRQAIPHGVRVAG